MINGITRQEFILTQKLPSKNSMPIDFEEMEFTIENEEWNEYELKDGVRIRGRIILNKIIRDPYNPNTFSFDFSRPIWVVSAPMASRGESNWRELKRTQAKNSKFMWTEIMSHGTYTEL